tara:strand:- start:49 stop:219 length:171 start_codon:yes stop_codon:yes gene_type:complete
MGNNLNNVISVLIDFHCQALDGVIDLEAIEQSVEDLKRINQELQALKKQIGKVANY